MAYIWVHYNLLNEYQTRIMLSLLIFRLRDHHYIFKKRDDRCSIIESERIECTARRRLTRIEMKSEFRRMGIYLARLVDSQNANTYKYTHTTVNVQDRRLIDKERHVELSFTRYVCAICDGDTTSHRPSGSECGVFGVFS